MLGAIAVCLLTVGTVSVYALVGGTDISISRETKAATKPEQNVDLDFAEDFNNVIVEARFEEMPQTTTSTKATTEATKKTTEKTTTVKETTAKTTEKVTTTAAETTVKKTTAKKTTTSKATTKATTKKTTKKTTATAVKPQTSVIKYTEEEFVMMCYVLQNEAGNLSAKSKIAVSNVIINRVKSSRFANSVAEVLTQQGQFTCINNYYNKTNPPSQHTKDCVRRALNGEDYSNGALFYYAPKYCGGSTAAWFESLTFCIELEGQRFFK